MNNDSNNATYKQHRLDIEYLRHDKLKINFNVYIYDFHVWMWKSFYYNQSQLWSHNSIIKPAFVNSIRQKCVQLCSYQTEKLRQGDHLQGTSPTAACQSPKFPAGDISVRPAVANWKLHGFVAEHLAPSGLFQSPVGSTVWNSLPDSLRHPAVESERIRRDLKPLLFAVGH